MFKTAVIINALSAYRLLNLWVPFIHTICIRMFEFQLIRVYLFIHALVFILVSGLVVGMYENHFKSKTMNFFVCMYFCQIVRRI